MLRHATYRHMTWGLLLLLCSMSYLRGADDAARSPVVGIPAQADPATVIDLLVGAKWQELGIAPSPRCDDATFLRRLSLDLLGRIPTSGELNEFLADTRSDKRDRWIDRWLADPQHAHHWAELFDTMLMGRRDARGMAEREKSGWLAYLEESIARNTSWRKMASDILLARASDATDVRASWYLYERKNAHQEIAEAVAPGFFGIRIECAQCHDHPLASEILQSHYWGMVAFFNRSKNQETPRGPRVIEGAVGGFQKFTDLSGASFDTRLTFFASPVVEEARIPDEVKESPEQFLASVNEEPPIPKFSRRQAFVERILFDHPLVARAMANRLWAVMLGRGLVHPFDRMDSIHPPSHPELLDWLAADFARSNYDMRRLIRALARSQAYQLDARPTSEQVLPEHFAAAIPKPLTAEMLARSLLIVTHDAPQPVDAELMSSLRKAFPDLLAEVVVAQPAQALLWTNDARIERLLSDPHCATLAAMQAPSDPAACVSIAFLRILGRLPDNAEREQAAAYLAAHAGAARGAQHLLWALVTSAEFQFNH